MIRVQLWSGDTLLQETVVTNEKLADRAMDQIITDVHAGRFREGIYTLEADRIDPRNRTFLGSYWRTEELSYELLRT